jgi:hypothetical protein
MADISITAASVVASSAAKTHTALAGETIVAGKAVYLASATGKYMLADSNSATAEARVPKGIALCASSLNQPCVVVTSGQVTIGATLTAGVAYYLSDTPGGICPVADVGSGEYPCILGLAKTTAILDLKIQAAGVAL